MLTVEPELIANYVETGQVKLVFKPVLDFNPGSQIATEAAYCAGEQDAALFWGMHDLLYERQSELSTAKDMVAESLRYADELGLAPEPFVACMNRHRYADQIVAQDQARRAEGIRQRPSFKISGPALTEPRLIAGAQPFSNFQKLIAEAIGQ